MNNSNWQLWGPALLRSVIGIVFLMHGGQKLFVWGFHGVASFLGHIGVPLPAFFAVVVTLVEFIAGAALVLGLWTRWVALPLAIDMLVAILTVKFRGGFFAPRGFEYELTLLIACLSLTVMGGGRASLDSLIRG
jgi:putative oxidoreductase